MEYLESAGISEIRILFYYLIVALGAVYTLMRFGINKLSVLIVLIFWEGLIGYFCKVSNFPFEIYRVLIVIYSAVFFIPSINRKKYKADKYINITFILFSILFWISNLSFLQSFFTVASQFGFKYCLPFLFYHGTKDMLFNHKKARYLMNILLVVIFLQVGFSIAKAVIMGIFEGVVGSLSAKGAGTAVVIPILGFLLYWVIKAGILKRKEWLFAISLLFIAISNAKRAPVFLFPAIVLMTQVFIRKTIKLSSVLKYSPIILIVFYLGIRTNVTLNPDKSLWGSFDLNYAISYAMKYNFGTDKLEEIGEEHIGRGGSLFLLFDPKGLDLSSISETLFGHGVVDVVLQTQGKFTGSNKSYDIGAESLFGKGIAVVYIFGYCGLIAYLLFAFSLIRIINNKKFRLLVGLFFLWEFFLYGGVILNSNAMAFIFVVMCLYSNITLNFKVRNANAMFSIIGVNKKIEMSDSKLKNVKND